MASGIIRSPAKVDTLISLPGNELEVELLRYVLKKHGHVSSERILSGPGIKNIYDFLRDTKKVEEPGVAERADGENS